MYSHISGSNGGATIQPYTPTYNANYRSDGQSLWVKQVRGSDVDIEVIEDVSYNSSLLEEVYVMVRS